MLGPEHWAGLRASFRSLLRYTGRARLSFRGFRVSGCGGRIYRILQRRASTVSGGLELRRNGG